LLQGNTPYLDSGNYQVLEYPPLTGWFLEAERLVSKLLGAPQGADLSELDRVRSTLLFLDVNIVLLGALFLITVWAQVYAVPGRPWDALMLAASPCVVAAALINWDLLAVALTACGLLLWSRRQPALTGLLLGLGMAAKLYPGLLLGPLFLLCLRSRRMADFWSMLSTFVISWLAVNLPVLILAPDAWRSFWQFNSDRGGDLGSFWYVLSLAGYELGQVNLVSLGLFALGCMGIAVLIIFAPRRPRLGSVAFLVVAAFLITNKVYSPQFGLWLLPWFALTLPDLRLFVAFQVTDLAVFVTRFEWFARFLDVGPGVPFGAFEVAVLARAAVLVACMVVWVRRPADVPARRALETA
jgi:uncharacterized membrane protein